MKRWIGLLLIGVMGVFMTGCGQGGSDELVIYSGRSQPLVEGLVEKFEQQHDVSVNVKYGKDAQLLAALQEEGDQTPADVFWANTTGALSTAVERDLLSTLPTSTTDQLQRFVPENRRWVPVTTRFRVMAYNPNNISPDELPSSVMDLPEVSELEGRIGWTPTYSSFQDFLTVMRHVEGEEQTREWLNGMKDLNPKSYTGNSPMIRAIAAGELDVALTNHYYVLGLKHGGYEGYYEGDEEEEGEEEEEEESSPRPDAPVETYRFAEGDPGNLAMVTGAGVLSASNQSDAARDFVNFLLSDEGQAFAANTVNEYPVVPGAPVPEYMVPVERALRLSPEFAPEQLEDLDATLEMLRAEGIL